MSIMCCIHVPEGIIMAADSRLTRTKNTNTIEIPTKDQNKNFLTFRTTYTSSDNSQKVLLINKTGTGISFCGDAIIDGVTVADFIRKFEIEKVECTDSTEEVAHKLLEYYNGDKTHFFVCGYNDDVPYVFDVNNKQIERSNIKNPTQSQAVVVDTANEEQLQSETEIPVNIKQNNVVHPSEIDIITYGALWAGQKTAITKIVNNPPILNADWNTMPLKDAIDFAEFLIDMTIKYERFCDEIQTCGGPIDILVITKDEAFWKQHKIFNA